MGAENSKGHGGQQGQRQPVRRGGHGAGRAAPLPLGGRSVEPAGSPTGSFAGSQPRLSASESRPVAIGHGGDGDFAGSGLLSSFQPATSVPRVVDRHSVVYGSPTYVGSAPSGGLHDSGNVSPSAPGSGGGGVATCGSFRSMSLTGGGEAGGGGAAPQTSSPRPISMASPSRDFFIGSPVTPLSSSTRRHGASFGAGGGGGGGMTAPIAIPTYSNANADDPGTCGSPVLKSYRQHSLSVSKMGHGRDFVGSPTSPKLVFSGSNPGAFSYGATQSNVTDLLNSPVTLSSAAASQPATGGGGGGSGGAPAVGGGSTAAPIHQRFLEITGYPLGLENYGNTCYCNSVIQLLYHCPPLRLRLLELHDIYHSKKGGAGFEEGTLLFHLSSLMAVMHKSNNRKKDVKKRELISPSALLRAVKEKNIVFNNNMQQDAHEFTMYILNDIMETESKMMTDPKNLALFTEENKKKKTPGLAFWRNSATKESRQSGTFAAAAAATGDSFALTPTGSERGKRGSRSGGKGKKGGSERDLRTPDLAPLQSILQGQFGSLTACLECGNISARDEVFIDLSLETQQGSSLLNCLHHFGDPEYFYGNNKVRCDNCSRPARAAKTIHVQRLPEYALLVHLKRFRYDVERQTFTKKADHVALPMTMDVEEYLTDPDELASETTMSSPATARNESSADRSYYDSHPDVFKPADDATKRKLRGVARHKARFTLTGFVAHLGEGPNLGHYFTCVKYGPNLWRRFDDDVVSTMTEREVEQYFGVPIDLSGVITTTAYILLYERVA